MLKSNKYPKIIFIYFTKDFFQYFLLTLISLATLIFFIDLIELFRRSSNKVGINFLQIASFYDIIGMAGLKIPSNVEKIIPFATLIGSIICFNQWRKKKLLHNIKDIWNFSVENTFSYPNLFLFCWPYFYYIIKSFFSSLK